MRNRFALSAPQVILQPFEYVQSVLEIDRRRPRITHKISFMRRLSRALTAFAALLIMVASSGVAPAVAADPPPPPCSDYLVIGARGSGEAMDNWNGMGARVGAYAEAASRLLPSTTHYYSLPYPASGINSTPPDFGWTDFVNSASLGGDQLYHLIRDRILTCPNERIGLIGYSQGSMVIQLALGDLTAVERNAITSIVLLANPFTPGGSSYSIYIDPDNGQVVAPHGAGALLSWPIPADVQGRTTEVCLDGDNMCTARGQLLSPPFSSTTGPPIDIDLLPGIFLNPVHSRYAEKFGSLDMPVTFGEVFAAQLLSPQCPNASDARMTIPDASVDGPGPTVGSDLNVAHCARQGSRQTTVDLHVKHTFIGDLRIVLRGPGGFSKELKAPDQSDGSTSLDKVYRLDASSVPNATGIWRLEITDVTRLDTGYLQNWSLWP
ncbi:cutinase family protein [Kribbella sp. NPDC051952]|uniref:cutinase family protein n=1 Tax=Kribbella sp. NPDC051952 TaxID=3154851 RepID=UPI003420E1DB